VSWPYVILVFLLGLMLGGTVGLLTAALFATRGPDPAEDR
jgi:hypothetical protein